jgi:hypothetical protein
VPPARLTPADGRIVFVGGLHRSGTTPLARWLSDHPGVSGLTATGVHEDEGQHLQSVYPIAGAHGGPGRFAFDPAARLTEASPLVSDDAAQRLIDAWEPYWDTSKPVLLEKSPPNLVRMRFLRALFPSSPFIIVVRHPIAVAVATSKWSRTGMDALIRHWLAGHRHLVDDAAAVGGVAVIRYEDLMADPATVMQRIFAFLSLPEYAGSWPVKAGLNDAYFAQFRSPRSPIRRRRNAAVARRYEDQVARFGYSLQQPEDLREPASEIGGLEPAGRVGAALSPASESGARPPSA